MVKIKLATFYIIFTLILAVSLGYLIKYASEKLATTEYAVTISKLKSWAYLSVVGFGLLGVVGALLPYKWGKPVMDTTYLFLLISVLIIEALIVVPYLKPKLQPLVPTVECKETPDIGSAQGAIDFVSCLFTGYQYDSSDQHAQKGWLGVTTFLIFYVILPFTFITALLWGLFNGLTTLDGLFGGASNIVKKLMTVVVALYATREVMGGILLQFFGMSMWGVAAIFIAGIITAFVKRIIISFIMVEITLTGLSDATKEDIELSYQYVKSFVDTLKKLHKVIKKKEMRAEQGYMAIIDSLENLKKRLSARRNKIAAEQADTIDLIITRASAIYAKKGAKAAVDYLDKAIDALIKGNGKARNIDLGIPEL